MSTRSPPGCFISHVAPCLWSGKAVKNSPKSCKPLLTWETCKKLLPPGFRLAQLWTLSPLGNEEHIHALGVSNGKQVSQNLITYFNWCLKTNTTLRKIGRTFLFFLVVLHVYFLCIEKLPLPVIISIHVVQSQNIHKLHFVIWSINVFLSIPSQKVIACLCVQPFMWTCTMKGQQDWHQTKTQASFLCCFHSSCEAIP